MLVNPQKAATDIVAGYLAKHGFVSHGETISREQLSEAIADYQKFHRIPVTGSATNETLRHMATPRICPHGDMMEVSTELPHWPVKEITWHVVNPGEFPGLTAEQVIAALDWAFSQWSSVCDIQFRMVDSDPLIWIECADIDKAGGMLAYSQLADGTVRKKIQRFDKQDQWCFHPGADIPHTMSMDLGRVACHELGHVLGIGHLPAGNLMQPLYSYRVSTPQDGDITEAVSRYGKPNK